MSNTLPPPRLYNPATDSPHLPALAALHSLCITTDFTLATFHPPLSPTRMLAYWTAIHTKCFTSNAAIFVQFSSPAETEVAGVVSLLMPESDTGPMRGEVNKLMVSPHHRRKGIAKRLMEMLEEYARGRARWMLMLDTTVGSPAETVYPMLGWREVGRVPNYAISHKDGKLRDEVFFYKDLRSEEEKAEGVVVRLVE